jgi:hypothetical protein
MQWQQYNYKWGTLFWCFFYSNTTPTSMTIHSTNSSTLDDEQHEQTILLDDKFICQQVLQLRKLTGWDSVSFTIPERKYTRPDYNLDNMISKRATTHMNIPISTRPYASVGGTKSSTRETAQRKKIDHLYNKIHFVNQPSIPLGTFRLHLLCCTHDLHKTKWFALMSYHFEIHDTRLYYTQIDFKRSHERILLLSESSPVTILASLEPDLA